MRARTRSMGPVVVLAAAAVSVATRCDDSPEYFPGSLAVEPATLPLLAVEGETASVEGAFTLALEGEDRASWIAFCDQPWAAVEPSSGALTPGTPLTLQVSADPTGLAAGSYTATVTVRDVKALLDPAFVTVDFTMAPPQGALAVTPAQMDFQVVEGSALSLQGTATLRYLGRGVVTWAVDVDDPWLTAEPSGGQVDEVTPSTLTITVDPAGLTVGQYTGHVTVSDVGGTADAAVLVVILDVRPTGALQVSPRLAHLYALVGDALPAETTVTLSLLRGVSTDWTAEAADAWLGVDPAAGTLLSGGETEVMLSVDPASRTAGLHVTAVEFSAPPDEAAGVTLTVSFTLRATGEKISELAYYVSDIDDTRQPYGIYRPQGFAPGAGSAVAVFMHVYGGHASASFSAKKKEKADSGGMILVNLEGRGQHQYNGAAETDLFEVLADVDAAYKVDRARVFLEGCSMGGTGSFRFIARHPDVFAGAGAVDGWTDYRLWHERWYAPAFPDNWECHPSQIENMEQASPLTHAENILSGRLFTRVDTGDIPVYSEGDPKLHARLVRLSTADDYDTNAGSHCAAYTESLPLETVQKIYDFFASRPSLDGDPANVRIRSNRLRTAKHAWLQVERFARNGWAELVADRTVAGGTCTYDLATRNVARFTIGSPPEGETVSFYRVIVDGVTCLDQAAGDVCFPLTINLALDDTGKVVSGGVYVPPASPVLEKAPALEGPVMRALQERFTVAYGSLHAQQWVTDRNRAEARKFCDYWAHVWSNGNYGFNAIWDSVPISGTLYFTKDLATVTGTDTLFMDEVALDGLVRVSTSSCWYRVQEVGSDTELVLTGSFFQNTVSGSGYAALTIAPVDEVDLTAADIASANLVIFGSEESSALIAEMATSASVPFNLPVRIAEDEITLGTDSYAVPDHGIWMAYPNPLAPARLAVIGHYVIGSGTPEGKYDLIFWTHDSWAWRWPEYVVFDTTIQPRIEVSGGSERFTPDQYVDWGFFDQDWRLPSSGDAGTVVDVTGATYYDGGGGTYYVGLTVGVEDEIGSPVPGLDLVPGAFDVRIDGEYWASTFTETGTPGVYTADVEVWGLIDAGYCLTVEVLRPEAGGPAVGLGRARLSVP